MTDTYGDIDHFTTRGGVSPLGHDAESRAYEAWMRKERELEQWQQGNGLNPPRVVLEECSEYRDRWLTKFWGSMKKEPHNELLFQLQLKQFGKEL